MVKEFDGALAVSGRPVALHAFVVGYEPISEGVSIRGGRRDRYLLEPVTASAVEYADGWVLVDAGFNLAHVRDEAARARHYNYEGYTPIIPPGDPLRDALGRVGLGWETMAGCAISHAHVDHTGLAPSLPPHVPVLVQRREWEWVRDGASRPEFVIASDLLDAESSVRVLDGDTPLAPGLTALDTGGHTPGHQSFRVDLPSRSVVLACDAADLRANITTRTPCGWTPEEDGDVRAQRAIDRLADLDAAGVEVWPGHDPEFWAWAAAMRGERVRVE
ncbi:N-acyl homoserine lactonase family protein [Demequina phytophila]|uniref:N-acyl homoserine lactonase family protein n=1 Tax=Demequina phytophila TaxID=1638981 RepID=UPI0007840422|nr:N-acyl homoserine lactonase family protein [Demequina phytophila]